MGAGSVAGVKEATRFEVRSKQVQCHSGFDTSCHRAQLVSRSAAFHSLQLGSLQPPSANSEATFCYPSAQITTRPLSSPVTMALPQ